MSAVSEVGRAGHFLMRINFKIQRQDGIPKGARFMFAEGRWTDPGVHGVAITMHAFDTINDLVRIAWPEWNGYCGVSEIPPDAAWRLEAALRERASSAEGGLSRMCADLADWFQDARKTGGVLSLLGV
jgi:hypothetical protein